MCIYCFSYHCAYGPDDYRSAKKMLIDMSKKPEKGPGSRLDSSEGGPSIKRGCECNFAIKKLFKWPEVSEIIYYHVGHTDLCGSPCHGLLDHTADSERTSFQPWISSEMKAWILGKLAQKFTPSQIIALHIEKIMEEHGQDSIPAESWSRDSVLHIRDIFNVARSWNRRAYEKNNDDATSVLMWITENPSLFFYHQLSFGGTSGPYCIGIQLEWQTNFLLKYGHHSLISCDATFGVNKYKVKWITNILTSTHNKAIFLKLMVINLFALEVVAQCFFSLHIVLNILFLLC